MRIISLTGSNVSVAPNSSGYIELAADDVLLQADSSRYALSVHLQ